MFAPVPLLARGDTVYLGLADTMLVYRRVGEPEVVSFGFGQRIVSLAASARNTRTRIAVAFTQGGTVCWNDFEGPYREAFSSELERPAIGFNRDGYLIAAGTDGAEIYATQNRRLQLEADLRGATSQPIAVLPGPRTGQFGIGTADGEILVYELG
jgi:hypothetical protein